MSLEQIGYGAGSRAPASHPNVLRVILGSSVAPQTGDVVVLETHLDDVSGEVLADACEILRELGALDVAVGPLQMKKGRSGVRLTVVGDPAAEGVLAAAILENTPTLGVRVRAERRHVLPRAEAVVDTAYGAQRVKLRRTPSGRVEAAPEFETSRAAAATHGVTIGEVYAEVGTATRGALRAGTLEWPDAHPRPWPELLRHTVRDLSRRPGHSWTGIYLVDGELLRLGPFVGAPTEHVVIPVGAGICGAAAADRATIVVDDVAADPRYLACFASTRSEIVVPIYAGGIPSAAVIGEIDVDSDHAAAFDPADRQYLEKVAGQLGRRAPADVLAGVIQAECLTP
jgi:putative methionine-R-sulfoxide reductase with GAF domain